MSSTAPRPEQIIVPYSLDSVLDEFTVPIKNRGLSVAQNVVYRRSGGFGKRAGSKPYGAAANAFVSVGNAPVISGTRWYRGVFNAAPAQLKSLIVQANNALYLGNDTTGQFTAIGALPPGTSPAFYASAFDATNTGSSPNSDILIVAYGSGQPIKWDGSHFGYLSSAITNPFAGCVSFNEHIFFWGDPSFPDTLFATDLGNPEAYTFTAGFGGYQIGRGNGDSLVRVVVPVGQSLFVFKTNSVYLIQGYDFYPGQYQFSDQNLLTGVGTTAAQSVALLRNALIWWTGQTFVRLALGETEATDIGYPIQNTIATVANGNPAVMRAIAGDFLVSSVEGHRVYNNVYLCACDVGSGAATTILMYDEQISAERGKPAWSVLTGITITSFIPFKGNQGDQRILYLGTSAGQVLQFGADAYADVNYPVGGGAPIRNNIPVVMRTGRNDAGTPNQTKRLDRLFVDAETTSATFLVSTLSDIQASPIEIAVAATVNPGGIYGQSVYGGAMYGPANASAYVGNEIPVTPEVAGKNFITQITESSNSAAYEIVALSYHAIQEAVQY